MARFIESVVVSSRSDGIIAPAYPDRAKRLLPEKEGIYDSAALCSRQLLGNQRRLLVAAEGETKDCTLLASETVKLPGADCGTDSASYVGAVSFGRKNGNGITTVLSYVDILPPHTGSAPYAQAGYIETALNEQNEKVFIKRPVINIPEGKDAEELIRQYAGGLTDEVRQLAEKVGRFEHEVEPLMQSMVADHPFNTLSFYSRAGVMDKGDFYRQVTTEESGYFDENGGNCVLFTLNTARALKKNGFQLKAAVIPQSEVLPSGHSALIVSDRTRQLSFFVDPGLSLTQPIVLTENIPFYPFEFDGNKQIYVGFKESGLPTIRIHTKKAKSNLVMEQPLDFGEFEQKAVSLLSGMDETRTHAKLDYHRTDGTSIFACTVDLKRGVLSLRGGDLNVHGLPIDRFREDAGLQTRLDAYLATYNLNLNYLLQQLAKSGS